MASLDDILDGIAIQVETAVAQRLSGQVVKQKEELKNVFIYGLKPGQGKMINTDLKGLFNFRHLKDARPAPIQAGVKWADKTFVMCDFISHSDYAHLKAGEKVVHVNGTLTALKDELSKYFMED